MKKLFLTAFLLLLGGGTARAQGQYVSGAITAADSGTECATVNGFVSIPVAVSATVSFNVSGTFSATLSFVTTVDGTNYAAINAFPPNSTTAVTSTTGPGTWTVSVPAMATFCVRASAYTSGSATVNMRNSTLVNASIIGGGGGGGSGSTTNQTAKGISYNSSGTATAVDASIAAPTTNGQYTCGYTVTASAAVAPTCPQVGLAPDQAAGATVLYSDNNNVIYNPAAALSLPTPTTLANANFFTVIKTPGGTASTLTPVTWTVSLNGATAGASAVLPAYNSCTVNVDQVASTQWDANCQSLNGTNQINAALLSGADFCAKVNTAITAATTGAVIDLSGFTTNQNCATVLAVSKSVSIVNGNVQVTCTMSDPGQTSGCVNVTANNVTISGTRNFIFTQGSAANIQTAIFLNGNAYLKLTGFKINWNEAAQTNASGYFTAVRSSTGTGGGNNILVDNMEFTGCGDRCIDFRGVSQTHIQNNWFHQTGITVPDGSAGNAISVDVDNTGGTIYESSDSWAVNNLFEEWGDTAVALLDGARFHVMGNTLKGRTFFSHTPLANEGGIGMQGCQDCEITGNHVIDVTGTSVFDAGTSYPLSNCIVSNNVRVTGNEFFMVASATKNSEFTIQTATCAGTISQVTITGNTFNRVRMQLAGITGLTVTGNLFQDETVGSGSTILLAMYNGNGGFGILKNFTISGNNFSQTDGQATTAIYVDSGVTTPGSSILGPNQIGTGLAAALGTTTNLPIITTGNASDTVTVGYSNCQGAPCGRLNAGVSLGIQGSTSGTLLQTTQAAEGTPTVSWGTNSGTPVVSVSAPLSITAATGNATCSTCVAGAQYKTFTCEAGLGDGLNAITAGTYLQSTCYNGTGATITITGVKCYIDGGSSSTLNAAGNTLGALLTGAITCGAFVGGTQSANVALTSTDYIKFTFVADGTAKQTDWVVTGTY